MSTRASQMVSFLLEDEPMSAAPLASMLQPVEDQLEVYGVHSQDGQWLGMISKHMETNLPPLTSPQTKARLLQSPWFAMPRRAPQKDGFATRDDAQRYVEQTAMSAVSQS
jgi:hypothetical protein